MNLKEQLQRLKTKEAPPKTTRTALSVRGQEVDTPYGTFLLREEEYALSAYHGSMQLGEFQDCSRDALALLAKDKELAGMDLEKVLFLDTETTGLSGGTGTVAFLVGLGMFQGDSFWVQQLFMRDYPEEAALLSYLAEVLKKCQFVVTFNGKSFDLPLLTTRYILARLAVSLPSLHLDLLHGARRLWKNALPRCNLSSLETYRLGVTRIQDIPGEEIPERYFQFLRTGDSSLMEEVFTHNHLDILSMVTLMTRLSITSACSPSQLTCPYEAEALGTLHLRERKEVAWRYYERALDLSPHPSFEAKLLSSLACCAKQLRSYESAEFYWKRLLSKAPSILAYEELAKHYEHKRVDVEEAIRLTKRAVALALVGAPKKVAELEYRLARLEKKNERRLGSLIL